MYNNRIKAAVLEPELVFTTSRSSGPGGQHVNKVNTKVTLRFDIAQSSILTDEQRELLLEKMKSRVTKDGELILTSDNKRSQLQNKEATLKKLDLLLAKAFTFKKSRKPTKPSKTAIQKRLSSKKLHSEKKKWRQKPL